MKTCFYKRCRQKAERRNGDSGVALVKVGDIGADRSAFRVEHDPAHPAADEAGNGASP